MHVGELDVMELGRDRVKGLHGEAVYEFTLQCALAVDPSLHPALQQSAEAIRWAYRNPVHRISSTSVSTVH